MPEERHLPRSTADVERAGGVVANADRFDLDQTIAYFDREAERLLTAAGSSQEREDLVFKRILPAIRRDPHGLRAIDFGCGSGSLLYKLLEAGVDATGVEVSPGMVAQARERLQQVKQRQAVLQGSTEQFAKFNDGSIDVVFVMGVLQYLEPETYEIVFREARRVLTPGGSLICSFQNAFFDLFTFNKYTMQFYEASLLGPMMPTGASVGPVTDAIRGLITNPTKPDYRPEIARDNILVRTTNPLTVGDELRARGFDLGQLLFYEFHPLPPLVRLQFPDVFAALKSRLEVDGATDWRGYFMANAFISVNTRA